MMKNHYDSRNALFRSSEYLANTLTRNTFIEMSFYRGENSRRRHEIGNAITRVYKAILLYTVEVRSAQNSSKRRKVLDCVTAMTNQSLAELQSSINQEEQYLQQWVRMDQYRQRREEAENMLDRIDETLSDLRSLLNDFVLEKLNSLDAARFDAYQKEDDLMDEYKGRCLPGTRTELLDEVMEWATSPDGKSIFWLNGMAGTGKSTVSRTLAESFETRGVLGASFFFKRGEGDRGDAKRLFTTIARQLVDRVPRMIPAITKAVRGGISEKSVEEQFKQLLQQPLLDLDQSSQQMQPMVIVIDALDECDFPRDIETLLQLIPQATQVQSIPLWFFLTSRPGLPKGFGFDGIENRDRQGVILQEIPEKIIKRDLSNYLTYQLKRIWVKKYGKEHGQDGPGESSI